MEVLYLFLLQWFLGLRCCFGQNIHHQPVRRLGNALDFWVVHISLWHPERRFLSVWPANVQVELRTVDNGHYRCGCSFTPCLQCLLKFTILQPMGVAYNQNFSSCILCLHFWNRSGSTTRGRSLTCLPTCQLARSALSTPLLHTTPWCCRVAQALSLTLSPIPSGCTGGQGSTSSTTSSPALSSTQSASKTQSTLQLCVSLFYSV